jgi:hypothetical protein
MVRCGLRDTFEVYGKKITITMSSSDKDINLAPLKIPSDKELGRTTK